MGWFEPRLLVRFWTSFVAWRQWRALLKLSPVAEECWRSVRDLPEVRSARHGLLQHADFNVFRRKGSRFEMQAYSIGDAAAPQWRPCSRDENEGLRLMFPKVKSLCLFAIARQEIFPKGSALYCGPIHSIFVCAETNSLLKVQRDEWRS